MIYNYFPSPDDLTKQNSTEEVGSKEKVVRCKREFFLESSVDLPVRIFFLNITDLPSREQVETNDEISEALRIRSH